MKTAFMISVMVPLALFGAFADKDWVKRTFAPTNTAVVADAAAVTNAQQDATIGQYGIAISNLQTEKQDKLPYDTNSIPDSAIASASVWNAKQNSISDLDTIRSGATAGSTAVQPSAISDMASKTWVGQQGFAKSSEISYPVTDVKVDGTSIVSGGVADVPLSGKQDVLPYPTNAVPWSVVSGGPTKTSDLTNDSGFITSSSLGSYVAKPKFGNTVYNRSLHVGTMMSQQSPDVQKEDEIVLGTYATGYNGVNRQWHSKVFVWNSGYTADSNTTGYYGPARDRTFNVNPAGGLAGFYVGNTNLSTHISNLSPKKISDLTNDVGYATQQSLSAKQDAISDYTTTGAVHSIVSGDVASWAMTGQADPTIEVPDTSSFSEWRIANSVVTNDGITVTAVHPPTYNDSTGKAVAEIVYEEGGETKFVYPEVVLYDGPTFGLSLKCYVWCDTVFGDSAILCFRRTTSAPLSKWSVMIRHTNSYSDSPYADNDYLGHDEPEFYCSTDWAPDSHWRTKVWYLDLSDGTVSTNYAGSSDRQYNDLISEDEYAGLDETGMRNYDLVLSSYLNDSLSVTLSRYPCKRATRAETMHNSYQATGIDDGALATSAYVRQGLRGKADKSELSSKADVMYVNSASNNVLVAAKVYTDESLPTKVSDLTNDSGFITSSSLPTKVSDLSIDSTTTNVIREVTGTFWDPGLTVTWRMFCTNGNFYVSAITNVDVTGVQP